MKPNILIEPKMRSIIIKSRFKDFEHFCEVLVNEILTTHKFTDVLKNIEYIDGKSDLGNRVFVMIGETEYMIRTWDIYDTDQYVVVDYTLFKQMDNGEYEAV